MAKKKNIHTSWNSNYYWTYRSLFSLDIREIQTKIWLIYLNYKISKKFFEDNDPYRQHCKEAKDTGSEDSWT